MLKEHKKIAQSPRKLARHITRQYVLALMLLAMLTLSTNVILNRLIESQRSHAELSELASTQRILFQEAGIMVGRLVKEARSAADNNLLLDTVRRNLTQIVAELKATHERLESIAKTFRASPFLALPKNTEELIRPNWLEVKLNDFIHNVELLTTLDRKALNQRVHLWLSVGLSVAGNGQLTTAFESEMKEFNALTQANIDYLQKIHSALSTLMIVSLGLVGLLIFYPLVRRLRSQHELALQAQAQLSNIALHDMLTGLANRNQLEHAFGSSLAERVESRKAALLLIDLDDFKAVNDGFGHRAGDEVLRVVSRRLMALGTADTLIARIGGDEFTIIVTGGVPIGQVKFLAQRIVEELQQPIVVDGREHLIGASVGIAFCPEHGGTVSELLVAADNAMYEAKKLGKGTVFVFNDELRQRLARSIEMEKGLQKALRQDEFRIFFQPKQLVADGRHLGFEALVRWQSAEYGLLLPAVFIDVAERIRLIEAITVVVFEKVKQHRQQWLEAGLNPGRIAVNVPEVMLVKDLSESEAGRILLEDTDLGSWLDIEVTENVMLNQAERKVKQNLALLSKRGIGIHLDDFGTGYASLAHLRAFPCSALKIDRSFIKDITFDRDAESIVKAVIQLGKEMRKTVVGEGVETTTQLEFLKQQGCDVVQGYLFARPLAPEKVPDYLAAQSHQTTPVVRYLRAPLAGAKHLTKDRS